MKVGDIKVWRCHKCLQRGVIVDTRILRKQQICECIHCKDILRVTKNKGKGVRITRYGKDQCDEKRALALRVEISPEGDFLRILNPVPEELEGDE